jgi:hypothetical protein
VLLAKDCEIGQEQRVVSVARPMDRHQNVGLGCRLLPYVWILERSVIRPPSGEGAHDLCTLANQNWNKNAGGRRRPAAD